MSRTVSIERLYRYHLKGSGKGIGPVGFELWDRDTGERLHRTKDKKSCRLWAERRNWTIK